MIVIPMAGLSRRFADAGYALPKYMLPLGKRTVFAHAIESFRAYFADGVFLLIARDVSGTANFIEAECAALGIRQLKLVLLEKPTAGQAETVEIGLDSAQVKDDDAITVFNIDTFRHDFVYPAASWFIESDGYVEVFHGSGSNWSYVRPADTEDPIVLETAEKRPISNLCCDGLYHFARASDFRIALGAERRAPSSPELYVAPLYNHMIARGKRVHYAVVPPTQLTFCGIPAEYEALLG